jgi:large subunit GTPase 1
VQGQAGIVNKFLTEANIRNPQYTPLKIPRRPAWNKKMSAQEIHQQENMAFLEWRRDIATIEENNVKLAFTPFEKNIEVWKQLWRVIEKSDMLLQIVDARNPYFFYSADLEKYISEVGNGKEFVLCINKADYLSEELILHWNAYFKEKGVQHIFFSAKMEQEKLDEAEESDSEEEYDDEDDEEEKEFEPLFDELKKKIDIENELKEEQGIEFRKEVEEEKEVPAFEFNTV